MAFPNSSITGLLAAAAVLSLGAVAAPLAAQAQTPQAQERPPAVDEAASQTEGSSKRFLCQDGGTLLTRFATEHGRLVAIVDAFDGDGPHTLVSRPPELAPVQLIWSDGRRTLTWSPGVQIMWMDTGVHRMCGGGHHH
jgi:hypothetical protein